MREIKRGEIYWIVPNGINGSLQQFRRPAIIVSNDKGNKFAPVVEIIYLTSAHKKLLPTHITIKSAICTSIALCEQITTIQKENVSKYIGKCTEQEMKNINRGIMISLGIIE